MEKEHNIENNMDMRHDKKRSSIDLRSHVVKVSVSKEVNKGTPKSIASETLQNMWEERDKLRQKKSQGGVAGIFKKNTRLIVSICGVIFVVIALFAFYKEEPIESIPEVAEVVDSVVVPVADKPPFDKNIFYGLATVQGDLYFARIIDVDEVGYHLENIFYEKGNKGDLVDPNSPEAVVDGPSNSITLVKFGTEAYQPEDTLVIPNTQVTNVFPLGVNSPILKAINAYTNSQ